MKFFFILLIFAVFLSSCSTSTIISSEITALENYKMYYFEPVAEIDLIEKGNKTQ